MSLVIRKKALQKRHRAVYVDVIPDNLKILVPEDSLWTFSEGVYYESNVVYWIKNILSDKKYDKVFYDIGANIGYYSNLASNYADQVYAFEPVDSTLKLLKTNKKLNGQKNIQIMPCAISDKSGDAYIHTYSSSGNNSIFKRNIPKGHELKFRGKQKINLSTIDELVQSGELKPPSFIKIDVEGAELPALRGASKTIKNAQPIIVCEYSVATSHDAGYERHEIVKYLEALDYRVRALSGDVKDNKLYDLSSKTSREYDNIVGFPKNVNAWL